MNFLMTCKLIEVCKLDFDCLIFQRVSISPQSHHRPYDQRVFSVEMNGFTTPQRKLEKKGVTGSAPIDQHSVVHSIPKVHILYNNLFRFQMKKVTLFKCFCESKSELIGMKNHRKSLTFYRLGWVEFYRFLKFLNILFGQNSDF